MSFFDLLFGRNRKKRDKPQRFGSKKGSRKKEDQPNESLDEPQKSVVELTEDLCEREELLMKIHDFLAKKIELEVVPAKKNAETKAMELKALKYKKCLEKNIRILSDDLDWLKEEGVPFLITTIADALRTMKIAEDTVKISYKEYCEVISDPDFGQGFDKDELEAELELEMQQALGVRHQKTAEKLNGEAIKNLCEIEEGIMKMQDCLKKKIKSEMILARKNPEHKVMALDALKKKKCNDKILQQIEKLKNAYKEIGEAISKPVEPDFGQDFDEDELEAELNEVQKKLEAKFKRKPLPIDEEEIRNREEQHRIKMEAKKSPGKK